MLPSVFFLLYIAFASEEICGSKRKKSEVMQVSHCLREGASYRNPEPYG